MTEYQQGNSLWSDARRRLMKNRAAVASLVFLALMVLACFVLPLFPCIANPNATDLGNIAAGCSWQHLFGTDQLGRDLLARVLYGGRISLLVGVVATVVSFAIGLAYGLVSGYAGGRLDAFMMRTVDVLFALPFIDYEPPLTLMMSIADSGISEFGLCAYSLAVCISFLWCVFNLLPMFPLDGGRLLGTLINNVRVASAIGLVLALAFAVWSLTEGVWFNVLLGGYLAYLNFNFLRAPKGDGPEE